MNRLYKHEDVVQMLTDVIEQIEENEGIEIVDRPMGWESVRDYAEEVVSDIPSAEPKQGEWIISEVRFGNYKYQCKECGWHEYHAYNDVKPHNFCPNCGTRMTDKDIDVPYKTYEDGMAEAWRIAQIVFGSTVTLYEAIDVAKCMKGADDE